jgi:excisionase family DNA binding protein
MDERIESPMTVDEIAELTGIAHGGVLAEIHSGQLLARKIRGRYLITAQNYTEWLASDQPRFPAWGHVRADQVAAFLSVDRSWVYDHKPELGAVRVGGAVRFDATEVRAYVRKRRVVPEPPPPARLRPGPRRGSRKKRGFELLPIPEDAR